RWSAPRLAAGLGIAVPARKATVDAVARKVIVQQGAKVEFLPGPGTRLRITADHLPLGPWALAVAGLLARRWELRAGGKVLATATGEDWAGGVAVERGPEHDQADKLRQAIVRKNELYFHRWRPQNVTYLFGFRKHEQGKNAREIPQFDPLVLALEKEIAKL